MKGTIEATKFGPPCPQFFYGRVIGHEDCLFLNVFTPEVIIKLITTIIFVVTKGY